MRAREAIKLHKGDEVKNKNNGEIISVICAFEEPGVVMIEGTGTLSGYNHWPHTAVK